MSLRNGWLNERVWSVLGWLLVSAFFLFAGMQYAENILIVQAYGGWSPMDWVAHQLQPENFEADFPSGIAAYRMSSFMQIYLLAAQLGVNLETLMPWVIYFEIIFLGISAAILFRSMAPRMPYVATLIFSVLVVEGSARSMDLSSFGTAFYQGIFYNVAWGMALIGVAFLFRGRILWAAITLGVGVTVHPVIVGMACIFVMPYVILIWRSFPLRKWLLAAVSFLLITGLWFFFRLQSAEVASGGIPFGTWISLVRMFTFHWFPVDIGVFSSMHARYILPLLCLISLATLYLTQVISAPIERRGVAGGLILLALLTGLGVLVSEFSSEPLLIKLALHRASAMLIMASLLIAVAGLVQEILDGRGLIAAGAAVLLLSPLLLPVYIFPVLGVIVYISLFAIKWYRAGKINHFKCAVACLVVLVLILVFYYLRGYANLDVYVGRYEFWRFLLFALAFFSLLRIMEQLSGSRAVVKQPFALLCLVVVLGYGLNSVEQKAALSDAGKKVAADYLEVQRWARTSTANNALFMVDPTIYYGWRDFSQRSSFGNLREWLHTGWLYDSRLSVYKEGMKRFDEFGIDLDSYLNERPAIAGYNRLTGDVRKHFYENDTEWFMGLSRKYGINYLVLKKDQVVQGLDFPKVFGNSTFVVYELKS